MIEKTTTSIPLPQEMEEYIKIILDIFDNINSSRDGPNIN